MRLFVLLIVCVTFIVDKTAAKRQGRKTSGSDGQLEDWQKRYLEKIQLLAREGGLPEDEWKGITKYDKDVCYAKPCLDSALEIMQASNFTVDPCGPDMWYDFVCARRVNSADNLNQLERLMHKVTQRTKLLLEKGLPPNAKKGKAQDFLLKEAQVYYHQCKTKARHDKADVQDILAYLSENYGDWPMITNRDPGSKFNWMNMVADLNRIERVGFKPFLLSADVGLSSTAILLDIGKTSTSITSDDFTKMMTRIQERASKKRPYRLDQLQGMSQFIGATGSAALASSQAQLITVKQLQDTTNQYLKQKKISTAGVNWLNFLQRIFKGTDIQVTPESPVLVSLNRVLKVVETVENYMSSDSEAVANALNFQFASMLLLESTNVLADLNSFKCNEQAGSKEDICYARVTEIFAYSLGKTYLSVYYNDKVETPAIKALMVKIQQGYIDAIESYEWMEESTKEYLKDKINSMQTFISQPDWTRDPKKLKEFYSGLSASTDRNSSYPRNYLAVTQWQVGKKRSWAHRLSKVTSFQQVNIYDSEWSRYLGTVNAQFHKVFNDARIEGGIVQPPLFAADRPGFMNFGGLGMVLSHEIGHSFDTQGRTYDKNGQNNKENWDSVSLERYKKWVQSILDDYSSEAHQTSETSAETIDSSKTLNEDIADILGVYISHLAYQEYLQDLKTEGKQEKILPGLKNFSPEKLFYMKYSNMWCDKKDVQSRFNDLWSIHSAGNTRATMPIKRSKQFAETFGCPLPKEFSYK